MKVIVNDVETLSQIRVAQVADYLKHRGWKRMRKQAWMQRGTFWRKDSGGKEPWEVLVPDAETFGDYALRVSELLEDLALQEGRSQVAVLRSIQMAGSEAGSVVMPITPHQKTAYAPDQPKSRYLVAGKLRKGPVKA